MAEKNRQLSDLNQELTQFAYSASHDLKAPLSTINGLLDITLEDLKDGDIEEVCRNVKKALEVGRRSADKVESVLDIARVSLEPIAVESFSLETVIMEIWQDLAGVNQQVQLHLSLQHQEPVVLERQTLKVILENLVTNALRYSDERKPERTVLLSSSQDGDVITVRVADNGIGIAESNQGAVFDMFKRLDERSASGLGLALVRKHVERLGGSIGLTSREGEGTEFFFSLPLAQRSVA